MTAVEITNRKALVWGIVLLVVGILMTLGNLELPGVDHVWDFWPLILIGIGFGKLVAGSETPNLRSGLWLIGLGSWFLLASLELFGFDWSNSWPLVIILGGVVTLVAPRGPDDDGCTTCDRDRLEGIMPVVIGLFLLANTRHLWGLELEDSWPLLLVLVGAAIIVKALVSLGRRTDTEGIT